MNKAFRLFFVPLTVTLLTASLSLQVVEANAAEESDVRVVAQESTSAARQSSSEVVGVIEFVKIEGGCYRLKADNGRSYELLGKFPRKDGTRVQVRGELLRDRATTCQVGQLLQVESVKVLQSERQQRALEINIFGIGPAVDSRAVGAVRSVIGRAVAKGVIDTYITYGYGFEGGSSSCIQLSPFQNSSKLVQLRSELLRIKPNPQTTSYGVKAVADCSQHRN